METNHEESDLDSDQETTGSSQRDLLTPVSPSTPPPEILPPNPPTCQADQPSIPVIQPPPTPPPVIQDPPRATVDQSMDHTYRYQPPVQFNAIFPSQNPCPLPPYHTPYSYAEVPLSAGFEHPPPLVLEQSVVTQYQDALPQQYQVIVPMNSENEWPNIYHTQEIVRDPTTMMARRPALSIRRTTATDMRGKTFNKVQIGVSHTIDTATELYVIPAGHIRIEPTLHLGPEIHEIEMIRVVRPEHRQIAIQDTWGLLAQLSLKY